MATALNAPLNVNFQNGSQLTREIQGSVDRVQFNLGGEKGFRSLVQPLGRLTGQADEFTKSLDAANARVLAFGASVGVVNAVSNAFKALVNSTIEVEKDIIAISVVGDKFTGKSKELSQGLFSIAKATGQSFAEVSKAALEFARQGEGVEETLKRTKDALILTRTTGLDAAKSVGGLTAAVNAFAKAGLSTAQVINKLAAVDQAFAVSSADLIEAFQRTGAVAQQAGVSFDELAGIVTALQTETSRGGAVIGNALKTIFSRLQDTSTLTQLRDLGVAVQDLQGNLLPARQILQNLAGDVQGLSKVTQAGIFKEVAGTFQLNQLVSLVNDLNKAQSISASASRKSAGATNEAYVANEKLNQSLDAILNKVITTGKQLGSVLGEIGLTDNLKGLLDWVNSFLEGVNNILQGDNIGSRFAKGLVKGIGAVLSGPGLGIFLAIIVKLSSDLFRFGAESLKTFFNIGKAASDQKQIQESIVQVLLRNRSVLKEIENTQGGQNAQALKFLGILNQQAAAMKDVQGLASNIAGKAYSAGYRQTDRGLARKAAGGYLPAQEASDVRRGVGGASPSSKVVAIPNFAFGGGQRGTMIANTSEYIVPNYAGGGSAIFNQDMVKTMGLPAGAKKIGAAGGFVPNFAAQQKNISFDNYSAEKLLKKAKSFEQINRVDLSKDDFNGNINIIRQQLTNDEYNASAQDITKKIIPTLGKSTGKVINDKYLEEQIASFEKQGIDPFSIKRLKTSIFNATPNNGGFLNIRNQIKGIIGEIDASVLSGQSLTSGNADLDLAGGGEVKTRRRTPLSNLIKKSANNLLRIKNFNNNTPDSIGLPNLDVYLPKGGSIDKSASNGYIPNFANYIFDRDKIPSGLSGTILNSILASSKRKDLIVGPAGSGKSTVAAGLGTFIKTLDDLNKATSFTVLSSSGLSSKGALTEPFQNILSAVNRSGGKTTYLATANEELKKRRASRTLSGGDVRSAGELSGALYAPLNQRSFIKQLKKESSNFELMRQKNTSGFKNSDLAVLGLYGQKGSVNGSSVYTLNSERPDLTKDIKKEYEVRVKSFVRSYSQELANKIGIKRSPKEVKKALQQSSSVSGFIFEDVLNQLSGGFNTASLSGGSRIDFQMTPNLKTVFGTGGEKYAEAKLNPYSSDAVQSIIEKQNALASGRASLPQKTSNVQSIKAQWFAYQNRENKREGFEDFNSIARSLNINPTVGSKSSITDKINAALKSAATGYVPNFAAAALQQAIAREKSAGLSDSQIYVDQNPSLKSSLNPMGLMVANTRDEPSGGIQGISRARNEGANPKTYGAANGFVPNYAAKQELQSQGITISIENGEKFDKKLQELADEVSKQTKTFKAASQELQGFITTLKTVGTKKKPSALYNESTQQAFLNLGREKLEAAKPAKEPKSVGDSLAKVIGIQSAAIGLQQVFESLADEGSDFAKTTKAIGGAIAAVTSGFTLLTAGLGELGIVLAGVTIGFNLLRDVFPDALQSIKESFGGLSREGQKASEALNKFAETVAAGGVTAEQAYENAVKQAQEAQLRTKAVQEGINPQTAEGIKDPAKLARELITKQASEIFKGINLETPTPKRKVSGLNLLVSGLLAGAADGAYAESAPTAKELAGKDLKALSDFSESTQKVILDIFEETVSLNKDGLLVLGKQLGKGKEAKELVTEGDLINYRAELLKTILGKKDVGNFIQTAVTNASKSGAFDENIFQEELRKSDIVRIPENLLKAVVEALPKFLQDKPENLLRQNLNNLLLEFDNFTSAINRAVTSKTSLLEGLVGSQTFSALSEQRQFQVKTGLERFQSNTNFQKNQRSILTEAKDYASKQASNIAASQGNPLLQKELETFVASGTLENLESVFNSLSKKTTLVGDDLTALRKQTSDLINRNKDLNVNRETEVQLLNFSIQERQTELAAIKTFYQGLDDFNKQIRDKEKEIRELDFKKTLSDQTAQYERELAQLTSTSPEELRARTQDADTKATAKQASIEKQQNEIRAKIELEKAINTVENIKALNRNTKALEDFLKQFTIKNLKDEYQSLSLQNTESSVDDFGNVIGSSTPEGLARMQAIQAQLDALQNPSQSNKLIKDLSSITFPTSPNQIDAKIAELGVLSDEDKAKYKTYFNNYFDQIAIGVDAEKARNDALKNQQGLDDQIFDIKKTYKDEISRELTSLRESQYSPKSMGQFAATERQIKTAQRKQSLQNDPEKLREYMSSFGYGFDEAMGKIEERTLDFRNQLGKEIPDLFSSNLSQGLNDAISGAKDLKTALTDAATSFFQEITKRNISNLADIVTGGLGKGASSGGGILSSIFSYFGGGSKTTGLASGGFIKGGSGTKDDVPAMLMGGEYVVKKSAVSKYGKGFLNAINSGSMRGYATGGIVDPQTFPTQTGSGGFFTPGDYGQGAITGKNELLTFATQSNTGGQYDYMGGFGTGGATVSLEPESARLSSFGRENSPMFERVQQSKDEAFRVYLEGLQKEKEYADLLEQIAKDKKARKKELQRAIISAVISSALSYAGTSMKVGAANASAAGGSKFAGAFMGSEGKGGLFNIAKGAGTSLTTSAKALEYAKIAPLISDLPAQVSKSSSNLSWPQAISANTNFINPLLPQLKAAGGLISGGSNIRDDVPAMLTGGEFVLNNRATQRIGTQNLHKLNSGAQIGGESSSAETTQALISKLDELIQTTANSSKENVVVNVSTSEADGQKQENPAGTEKELQKKIREAVLNVIAQEKRLGGSLEKSR